MAVDRKWLESQLNTATPCEIRYERGGMICETEAFVVWLGDDFVTLARVEHSSVINGWQTIRTECIRGLGTLGEVDREFIRRAMQVNGVELPLPPPERSSTFLEFLKTISNQFEIVVMNDNPELDYDSAAGANLSADEDMVLMRAMSRSGFWEVDPHSIQTKYVTDVLYGSIYEDTLGRMAEVENT